METFLESVGFFIYPLGLCSLLSVAVIVERLIALRRGAVLPAKLADAWERGASAGARVDSVAGRILTYAHERSASQSELTAFARHEVARLERGLFVLDIVVAAAPLIGLLGTVWGLYRVFGGFSPGEGMPEPSVFVENLGLALTTTMLGLIVALPALVGNFYLQRRVDVLAAELEVGVERLAGAFPESAQEEDSE